MTDKHLTTSQIDEAESDTAVAQFERDWRAIERRTYGPAAR